MDLDKPIWYRGLDLNSYTVGPSTGKRSGIVVEEFDYSGVQGVGYVEKRSQDDGNDASDVFLGARQVNLRGFIYGLSKAEGFDYLQQLRSAMTPSAAYQENPFERGYLPLEFEMPTEDLVNFPGIPTDTPPLPPGVKLLELRARPRAQPAFSVRRDSGGQGRPNGGSAISWAVAMECKDPRIYLRPGIVEYFTASESGTLTNRGDYPVPIGIFLEVPVASGAGTVVFNIAGTSVTITVPDSTAIQYIRYSGYHKVLTVESNSVEVLRMDLLGLDSDSTHPQVPPYPSPYVITKAAAVTLGASSRLFYSEAFA